MQKMTTYRRIVQISSALLFFAFIFAASHPARSYSLHKNTRSTYQNNLENLVIGSSSDWQSGFHVKTQFIGTTWDVFVNENISKLVRISEALRIGLKEFSPLLETPTINAP
jgi:hypothetical protein